ncbi:MAG: DUF4838 domain-containing protein [Defluviitaleaceae bacterium]|nr:DUF4838 domain-containing protein [Defluviitaleaceae bacterium]
MTAAQALDNYIYMMTERAHSIVIAIEPQAFGVQDPSEDDAYTIKASGGTGSITATNERAALIAAYHLLRECGCGFTRPGASGEIVPKKNVSEINADVSVKNAHRFRGICIEGSVSLEVALDLLDWMPKMGLNSYFMQFREGYAFFSRYYKEKSEFNLEISRDITRKILAKVKSLGLMYHGVGHGFTCDCYGIDATGWDQTPGVWPEKFQYAMALRGGERKMHWDIPLITALCYSNETVQETVTENAAQYIAAHDEYDYLHFWLDDGFNNKCECENCKDVRISDWYVKLLNRLDKKLTGLQCKTKIVFLSYCETHWPPLIETFGNSERFVFMFAPSNRSFNEPLGEAANGMPLPEYKLNDQPYAKNNEEMASFLAAWNDYRKKAGMDFNAGFDFDYYFNKYNDPGQFAAARIVYSDVLQLRGNGLNGVVNCQSQRIFANMGLPMYVYSAALLQPERSFESIADEYFCGAYTAGGGNIFKRLYLDLTEKSICLRDKSIKPEGFAGLDLLLDVPPPEIKVDCLGAAESLRILKFILRLYKKISEAVKAVRNADKEKYADALEKVKQYASANEPFFETVFDYFSFGLDEKLE